MAHIGRISNFRRKYHIWGCFTWFHEENLKGMHDEVREEYVEEEISYIRSQMSVYEGGKRSRSGRS